MDLKKLFRKNKDLKKELLEIKSILENVLLAQEVESLLQKVKGLTANTPVTKKPVPSQPLDKAIEELKNIATVRRTGKKTEFLLHRLTDDGEYTKSIGVDRSFQTHQETYWIPMFDVADKRMDAEGSTNPLVSCWIPEENISSIPVGAPNTGTWSILGKNPHASKYEIVVKPGKFELYQELKE